MAPILGIQLRQWSNSQGGVTVDAKRTLPLLLTHAPMRAHTHERMRVDEREGGVLLRDEKRPQKWDDGSFACNSV